MTPIIASAESDKPRELPDADLHNALCVFVYDLGHRLDPTWGKIQHKIIIAWELEQKMSDGRPFMLSKEYTLSLYEKADLFKHLTGWKGAELSEGELKAFDLDSLVGKMCRLEIIHKVVKGKTYANVNTVIKADKKVPQMVAVAKEPPKWFEAKRTEYASALASHEAAEAGQPQPEPHAGSQHDSIPF